MSGVPADLRFFPFGTTREMKHGTDLARCRQAVSRTTREMRRGEQTPTNLRFFPFPCRFPFPPRTIHCPTAYPARWRQLRNARSAPPHVRRRFLTPRLSVLPHARPSLLLNQLVVLSPRKRTNRRYGAGRKREKGRPRPSRPTTSSKTPGRRNRLEASGATSPPRTAPYRRFARFSADFSTT